MNQLLNITNAMRRHELSAMQVAVLCALHKVPGCSNREIKDRTVAGGPYVTRALDALIRHHLVRRQPHKTDRRLNVLHLTAAGEMVLRELNAALGAVPVREAA